MTRDRERPSLRACRGARCPSLYELRRGSPPARDLVQGPGPSGQGSSWGCAARVGGACRLCVVRPDLASRGQQQLPLLPADP